MENEEKNLSALTEYQMLRVHPPRPRSYWMQGLRLWNLDVCMLQLRIAAAFMEQMQLRRVDTTNMYAGMRSKGIMRYRQGPSY